MPPINSFFLWCVTLTWRQQQQRRRRGIISNIKEKSRFPEEPSKEKAQEKLRQLASPLFGSNHALDNFLDGILYSVIMSKDYCPID